MKYIKDDFESYQLSACKKTLQMQTYRLEINMEET